MRAAVINSPGGPEVIKITELDAPSPQPGEVTIDVAWAGVNFLDVMQRRGTYAGDGPFVCGAEVAGQIRETGPDVEGLKPGEAVVAFTRDGGYAEVASARAEHVVALCGELSAVRVREAACAPIVGVSAVALLDRIATVHDEDIVLVNAAAGGMGSVLARLARHLGAAQVIGTVGSEAKIPVARGFGYDHVVLRDQLHARLPELAPDGIDVALDPVGGTAFRQCLEALRPLGRLVRYGNASGAEDEPLATLGLVGIRQPNHRRLQPARARRHPSRCLQGAAQPSPRAHRGRRDPDRDQRRIRAGSSQRRPSPPRSRPNNRQAGDRPLSPSCRRRRR